MVFDTFFCHTFFSTFRVSHIADYLGYKNIALEELIV